MSEIAHKIIYKCGHVEFIHDDDIALFHAIEVRKKIASMRNCPDCHVMDPIGTISGGATPSCVIHGTRYAAHSRAIGRRELAYEIAREIIAGSPSQIKIMSATEEEAKLLQQEILKAIDAMIEPIKPITDAYAGSGGSGREG